MCQSSQVPFPLAVLRRSLEWIEVDDALILQAFEDHGLVKIVHTSHEYNSTTLIQLLIGVCSDEILEVVECDFFGRLECVQ